ncbi:hypothetical protein K1720_00230 [Thermococcus argininiproducens]|uniref:Uncharacterized protein n=1 Tax=Thermococcus argininiproducens TaxID=2866384 RepID=A0A9E7M9R3_9EURY|nr:hypothetical protein [Thermococcus argininiproducens]USG99954.1 hypothetical protein K1720_00230 [Thermococcus argininiproducens]
MKKMEGIKVYPIKDSERLKEVIKKVSNYNLLDVEVENRASLLDDMLKNKDERLEYVLQKLEENEIDEAKVVVRDDSVIITLKIEDVILIRFVFGNHNILKELGISG